MNSISVKFLLAAVVLVTIASCEKHPGSEQGCTHAAATNYNASAQIDDGTCLYASTFYFDQYGPNAVVKMNNEIADITTCYQNGAPTCGLTAPGCANFNLPVGTYTYTATSTLDAWHGTLLVNDGGCQMVVLHQSHGSVVFYTTTNYGTVIVNVNGVLDTITNNITNGTPACGASGCATFSLDPNITYSYTAANQSGATWSGHVVGPNPDQCATLLLQ